MLEIRSSLLDDYIITDMGPFRIIEFDSLLCQVEADPKYIHHVRDSELRRLKQLKQLSGEMWRATYRTMKLILDHFDEGVIIIVKNRSVLLDKDIKEQWNIDKVQKKVLEIIDIHKRLDEYIEANCQD